MKLVIHGQNENLGSFCFIIKKIYVGTRISSLSKKKKKKITRGAVFDNQTRFSSEIGSKTVFL